jgi:Lipocalin-like domain
MRRVAFVLAMVLPLTLGGCGDSTGPGGVAGTYSLRSINGDPLPAVIAEGTGFREEATAGFIRLNSGGTFTASNTSRITIGGSTNEVTLNISGTYTRSGDEITLTFDNPDGPGMSEVIVEWDGDRLTLFDFGDIWVYER